MRPAPHDTVDIVQLAHVEVERLDSAPGKDLAADRGLRPLAGESPCDDCARGDIAARFLTGESLDAERLVVVLRGEERQAVGEVLPLVTVEVNLELVTGLRVKQILMFDVADGGADVHDQGGGDTGVEDIQIGDVQPGVTTCGERVEVMRHGCAPSAQRIGATLVLNGNPVVRGELIHRPPAPEAAQTGLLLSAVGGVVLFVDGESFTWVIPASTRSANLTPRSWSAV